jgi:hypothetical protein
MIPSRKLCDCRSGDLYRVERDPWMRVVFPSRGLYQCSNCLRLMLAAAGEVVQARESRKLAPQPASVA